MIAQCPFLLELADFELLSKTTGLSIEIDNYGTLEGDKQVKNANGNNFNSVSGYWYSALFLHKMIKRTGTNLPECPKGEVFKEGKTKIHASSEVDTEGDD